MPYIADVPLTPFIEPSAPVLSREPPRGREWGGHFTRTNQFEVPMIRKALAVLISLVILTFAHDRSWAQTSEIRVMLAEGDSITKEEGSAVLRTIQEELNQLVARVRGAAQRHEDPVALLVGQNVRQAMMLVLVVKPQATTRMIGMVGTQDSQQNPSFVLYDISGWIDKGRPLNSLQALPPLDVLPDAEMKREGGRQFKVDNVAYTAAWVGDQLRIQRAK